MHIKAAPKLIFASVKHLKQMIINITKKSIKMFSKIAVVCVIFMMASTIEMLPYNSAIYSGNVRARRDIMSGTITTNPSGGNDALLKAQTGIGTNDHNLVGTAFAAGNTNKGPVATGGALAYNINDHGLSVAKTHIPGVADITDYNARVNLIKNDMNRLDANVFKSETNLPSGFDFTKTGGNLDFNTVSGHGAKFEISKIPELGTTYSAIGKLNLWESMDKATKLDLTGTASRTSGGLFNGRENYGAGLGLSHTFG